LFTFCSTECITDTDEPVKIGNQKFATSSKFEALDACALDFCCSKKTSLFFSNKSIIQVYKFKEHHFVVSDLVHFVAD
jgi:hypothetical protein